MRSTSQRNDEFGTLQGCGCGPKWAMGGAERSCGDVCEVVSRAETCKAVDAVCSLLPSTELPWGSRDEVVDVGVMEGLLWARR